MSNNKNVETTATTTAAPSQGATTPNTSATSGTPPAGTPFMRKRKPSKKTLGGLNIGQHLETKDGIDKLAVEWVKLTGTPNSTQIAEILFPKSTFLGTKRDKTGIVDRMRIFREVSFKAGVIAFRERCSALSILNTSNPELAKTIKAAISQFVETTRQQIEETSLPGITFTQSGLYRSDNKNAQENTDARFQDKGAPANANIHHRIFTYDTVSKYGNPLSIRINFFFCIAFEDITLEEDSTLFLSVVNGGYNRVSCQPNNTYFNYLKEFDLINDFKVAVKTINENAKLMEEQRNNQTGNPAAIASPAALTTQPKTPVNSGPSVDDIDWNNPDENGVG